jgi:osmotically-inducible protein OsmY
MKKLSFGFIIIAIAAMTATEISGCKGKSDKKDTTNNTTVDTTATAPVEVSSDEALRSGVKDATKDYPTVTATVSGGEVTLTGTLDRSKLQPLMQSIQSLNPKKVNNQLTLN